MANLEIDYSKSLHELCISIIEKYITIESPDMSYRKYGIKGKVLRLQYSIEQTRYHLTRFNILAQEAIRNYYDTNISAMYGKSPVFFELDATLSGLAHINDRFVRLYDAIEQRKNIKSKSCSDFINSIKKIPMNKNDKLIMDYWVKYGEKIKSYRDMIEHNEHIKRDFTLPFYISKNGMFILILLPDNPEVKSLDKLLYEQKIHAYKFLNDGYTYTIEYIENILPYLKELTIEEIDEYMSKMKNKDTNKKIDFWVLSLDEI